MIPAHLMNFLIVPITVWKNCIEHKICFIFLSKTLVGNIFSSPINIQWVTPDIGTCLQMLVKLCNTEMCSAVLGLLSADGQTCRLGEAVGRISTREKQRDRSAAASDLRALIVSQS
jgi:hypothetical protein